MPPPPPRGPGRRRCRSRRRRSGRPSACRPSRERARGCAPPDAPSGWPMAIAPPKALTFSGSIGHAFTHASDCAAKASLSSTRSTSSQVMPARLSALFAASTGPMPKMSGSTAWTPRPAIRASGVAVVVLAADQHGGGAVVERARVAGGDRPVLDEGGLELGQLLEERVGADALVARELGDGLRPSRRRSRRPRPWRRAGASAARTRPAPRGRPCGCPRASRCSRRARSSTRRASPG